MENEVHYYFGEVLKTFGTKGELLLKISKDVLKSEQIEEPVFIEIDGLQVPFYFDFFEFRGQRAKVIFENFDSEELAEELVGKKIFSTQIPENDQPDNNLPQLIGFRVEDARYGDLGFVSEIFEFPGNPCAEVDNSSQKIMIPLNGAIKFDYINRLIFTEIPDGLTEL